MAFHDRSMIEDLEALRMDLRGRHQRIVFTNGVFDILHAGHLRI